MGSGLENAYIENTNNASVGVSPSDAFILNQFNKPFSLVFQSTYYQFFT